MAFFINTPHQKTGLESLGEGFGATFGDTVQQRMGEFFKERKEQKDVNSLLENLKSLDPDASDVDKMMAVMQAKGSPESKAKVFEVLQKQEVNALLKQIEDGKPLTTQQIIKLSSNKLIPPGVAQIFAQNAETANLLKQLREESGHAPREKIQLEEEVRTPTEEAISETTEEIVPSGENISQQAPLNMGTLSQLSDEKLQDLVSSRGNVSKAATNILNQRQKDKENEYKKIKDKQEQRQWAHKETSDYAKSLRETGDSSSEVLAAVNEIKKLRDSGVTGPSLKNAFIKYLQKKNSFLAPAFINKDRQSLFSASKSLAGGFRQLFGARPTEREFFWYENILPDLLKDADTNEAAAEYFGKIAQNNLEMQQIYDEIVEQNDGYRPLDIDVQVRKRMKPKVDKLIEEGESLNKKRDDKKESTKGERKKSIAEMWRSY